MPSISVLSNSNPVASIYQSFNITFLIQLPFGYNNLVQVNSTPIQATPDGSVRIKMCSVVVGFIGANLPCSSCLGPGSLLSYAQNTTFSNLYDSFSWSLGTVMNFGFISDPSYGANNLT